MFIDDRYEVETDDEEAIFEFVSNGKNGSISKVVRYSKTNVKDMYNLGFGDKNITTGNIDDKIITDNGDSEKVLATVAATVYIFTAKNPRAYVAVVGSNHARTRLYRIAISKYLDKISEDFNIFGLPQRGGAWQPFKPNENYKAFLLQRKFIIE